MKHLIVCERCNTEMKPGKAIASSEEEGVIYCWTPYAYWPDIFMDVMKCPSCGNSLSYNEIERRKRNELNDTSRV